MLVEADQEEEEDFQRFLRRVDDIGKRGRGGAGRPMAGCGAAPPAGRWRGPGAGGYARPFPSGKGARGRKKKGVGNRKAGKEWKRGELSPRSEFVLYEVSLPLRVPGGAS